MKLITGVVTVLLLLLGNSVSEVVAQTQGENPQLSPSERRAFIRDSLRHERLQAIEGQQRRASNPPSEQMTDPGNDSPFTAEVQTDESGNEKIPENTEAYDTHAAQESQVYQEQKQYQEPSGEPEEQGTVQPSVEQELAMELPINDSVIVQSLNVRDTEIRDVLQGLGIQHKVNILMSPEVSGRISINLHKTKLKDALKLIAEENGYRLNVVHGSVKVEKKPAPAPPPPIKPRFEVSFKSGKLSVDLQNIPAQQVVRRLVEETKRTLLIEGGARGEMTAFFQDLEFDKAIRLLAHNNGFLLREKDGVITLVQESWQSAPQVSGAQGGGRMRIFVKEDKVSLEVTQAPIADIIASIAAQSGISTVVYGELLGTSTMKVNDVSIESALQFLFRGTDYTFWVNNGIYFIGPQSMQVADNSRLIVLKHLKAEEVMEILPESLIKNAQLKLVKSQNAIMVLGTYETIDGLNHYVNQVDLPVAQILIEALVVDVNLDKIRRYGMDLFLGDYRKVQSRETLYPEFEQVLNRERSQDILDQIPGLRNVISLPSNFVAKIEALEQEKVLRVRSKPQIATLNGSEAVLRIGQTQYFLLKSETDVGKIDGVTTRTTQRFEKIEANVTLTVTPFVTGKGEITCEIVPDFSEPEGSFDPNVPPTLNHRMLKSKVRLRDGETIVLGGFVKESRNRVSRQVPFLGSIPFLGWLFKNNDIVNSRSQMLIFVTPHVYYGADAHVEPGTYIKKNANLDK